MKALAKNGNPVSYSALQQRVSNQRAADAKAEAYANTASLNVAAAALVHLAGTNSAAPVKSPPPPSSKHPAVTPGTSARKRGKSKSNRKSPPETGIDTVAVAKAAAIEMLPEWIARDPTTNVMSKRKKRTSKEVNQDTFSEQACKRFRNAKYSEALKGASKEYAEAQKGPNKGKRGFGLRDIAQKWNDEKLNSPEQRKITKGSLGNAVVNGRVGLSPPKRGRPPVLPQEFTAALAVHATMMQVSGEGEASGKKMITIAKALTVGTKWDGKVQPEWIWRKTRMDNPAIMNPAKTRDGEDHRVDWLTFSNINQWTDAAKKELIDLGMVKDEPGYISKFVLYYCALCSVSMF